jgi:hypothetical protein
VDRQESTETQDVYGTPIRLTPEGLSYGEEFVAFAEMGDGQPQAHVFWNPGTKLFEVTVLRRNGPDLLIKHLSLHTAERLSEAIIDVLRERCR